MHKLFNTLLIGLACLLVVGTTQAEAKKFRRALVITGGGISPAVGLGILAAAEERGWIPDVIISTCGSSISTAIYNSYLNSRDSLAYAKSPAFHQGFLQMRVATPSVLEMKDKFDAMEANPSVIPQFFNKVVLQVPEVLDMRLPNPNFNVGGGPRLIVVSSKALFQPSQVGQAKPAKMFVESLFTDPDTAQAIRGFRSPVAQAPGSTIDSNVEVLTNLSLQQAVRASIADPFLLNPITVNGSYYFTGAADLFPLELAEMLADEVMTTYPVSLFNQYEETAFKSAFGFSQTQRALQTVNNNRVQWIDMSGVDATKFDPAPEMLTIRNRVPASLAAFQSGIQTQYDFGLSRTREAFAAQPNGVQSRSHLREPINPRLYQNFTCANANAWKTERTTRVCMNDAWSGCDRRAATECTPVR